MQGKSDAAETVGGKKRVAYEGAKEQGAAKRPLHMRRPQLKTPAQALMERYKKLQAMRQQDQIERRLTELTSDDGAGPSSTQSSSAGPSPTQSSGAGGSKGRVAHQPKAVAPVLNKTKKQLLDRQASRDRYRLGCRLRYTDKINVNTRLAWRHLPGLPLLTNGFKNSR